MLIAFIIALGLLAMTDVSIVAKNNSQQQESFTLTSPVFKHNGKIPAKYTCDGENISPALAWSNTPKGTKSFVLIVDDPDAPGKTWVHWLLFNIQASTTMLPEKIEKGSFISGENDFYHMKGGVFQYGGPCPPSGTHHYHFTIYALDTKLDLTKDHDKAAVVQAMDGHILAQTTLIGTYQRKK